MDERAWKSQAEAGHAAVQRPPGVRVSLTPQRRWRDDITLPFRLHIR